MKTWLKQKTVGHSIILNDVFLVFLVSTFVVSLVSVCLFIERLLYTSAGSCDRLPLVAVNPNRCGETLINLSADGKSGAQHVSVTHPMFFHFSSRNPCLWAQNGRLLFLCPSFIITRLVFGLFRFVSGSATASVRRTSGLLATHRRWGMCPCFPHRRSGNVRRKESGRQRLQSAD